jgi:hypothetical protein
MIQGPSLQLEGCEPQQLLVCLVLCHLLAAWKSSAAMVYWRSSADFLVLVLQACPSADMKRPLIALCRPLFFFQNWASSNWKLSCLSSSPRWLHLESSDKTVLSMRPQMQLQSQSDHLAAGTCELQSHESIPLLRHILQSFDWNLPI